MSHSPQLAPAASAPAPTLEAQIRRKLDALFPPDESRRWLDTPQAALGGSPRELMARGEGERILRLLVRLEQGVPT